MTSWVLDGATSNTPIVRPVDIVHLGQDLRFEQGTLSVAV